MNAQASFDFVEIRDVQSAIPLPGETIAEALHRASGLLIKFRLDIEKALVYAYGSYSYDDVVAGIMQGRFEFYTLRNSYTICELQRSPQYSHYHIFLSGGDLEDVIALHQYLKPRAKELGCKYASINGREGWAKVLKKYGWEPRYTVLYKELD